MQCLLNRWFFKFLQNLMQLLNNHLFLLYLRMGAGTDANVFLIMYGDKGQSGKMKLKNSTTNQNPFEKGKKDTFKLATPNIGEITKINISHDGSGPGAGWYCESVEVLNLANKKSV